MGLKGFPQELMRMLDKRNGFYTFLSAPHIYPLNGNQVSSHTINHLFSWTQYYAKENESIVVFGQDAFGCQFGFSGNCGYFRLELETGEREELGTTLEGFWDCILQDAAVHTGYPLAEQWQIKNGALPTHHRLCPIIPFFMGGQYATENLMAIHTIERIRLGIDIFHQTKNIPDGQQVVLKVIP